MQAGVLNFTVTDASLPPDVHKYFQLNTTFFRYIFPNLYSRFPNDLMQLTLFPADVRPVVAVAGQGISGGIGMFVNVSIMQGADGP